jgi:putative transport protein
MARAFRVENGDVVGRTPREFNTEFGNSLGGAFITRYREGSAILEADAPTPIQSGATIAMAGSPKALFHAEKMVGPEVDDGELLAYAAEKIDIVVTRKAAANLTLRDLERDELAKYGRPVFVLGLTRRGHPVALSPDLEIEHRDVLTVRGVRSHVERLIKALGYADRATTRSDIAFMGAGIVIGSLVGTITVYAAGVPLSLSPSVGTLLAGLIFGYLRSIYRTFGGIPPAGLWVFNNVGLNGFIAAVGLNAGPGLVSGLAHYGVGLFAAGVVVSLLPLVVGLYVGKYVFKFHPAILLGACAGARSCTAALGALQEASQSTVPTIGYTVPYAVSRIVLAMSGIVILLLMK